MSKNAQSTEERPARYADSLDAAAGALGYSVEFLQRLKSMGSQAFRGSRVYLDELEAYIQDNNLEGLEREIEADKAVDAELRRERLRKIRFANDVEERKYILKENLAQRVLELGLELNAVLQEKLEDAGPDLFAGKTRDELVPMCRRLRDEICAKFQKTTKKWSRTQ